VSRGVSVRGQLVPPELLEGQVLPEEGALLRRLARTVRASHVIVELGSYTGKSTCCLATGSAEGNRALIYAVDLWTDGTYDEETHGFYKYDPASGEEQRNSKFSRPRAQEIFKERVGDYDPLRLVKPMQGMTTIAANEFARERIGLLFIDADHRYEAVRADFEAWEPKVAEGGVVAFHDYKSLREGDGVKRFVDEELFGHGWREYASVGSLLAVKRDA